MIEYGRLDYGCVDSIVEVRGKTELRWKWMWKWVINEDITGCKSSH